MTLHFQIVASTHQILLVRLDLTFELEVEDTRTTLKSAGDVVSILIKYHVLERNQCFAQPSFEHDIHGCDLVFGATVAHGHACVDVLDIALHGDDEVILGLRHAEIESEKGSKEKVHFSEEKKSFVGLKSGLSILCVSGHRYRYQISNMGGITPTSPEFLQYFVFCD
jgi:hypothetical protein